MRTRPAASSAASPVSPLPALLLTPRSGRAAPCADQRVDQLDRHAGHAEAADQHGRRRPRCRRPPRPASATHRRVTTGPRRVDVLQHDGEALADADADRGDAPPLARARAAAWPACRGSGRPRRRAGGRSRSRRRWVLTISGSMLPGVDAGQRLHGERLVELDRADVGPADAGPRAAPGSAASTGAKPKHLRLERVRAAAGDPGQRVERRSGVGRRLGAEQHRGRAVVERRGVAGGDGAVRAGTTASARPASRRVRARAGSPRRGPGRRPGTGDHQVVVEARRPRPRRRAGASAAANSSCRSRRDAELLLQLLVGLAERDRPLRRHPRVDQPPAQRGRDRGRRRRPGRPAPAWAAPTAPGSSTRRRRPARPRRRRSRSCREPIIAASRLTSRRAG